VLVALFQNRVWIRPFAGHGAASVVVAEHVVDARRNFVDFEFPCRQIVESPDHQSLHLSDLCVRISAFSAPTQSICID
jgi:hypothetical protein